MTRLLVPRVQQEEDTSSADASPSSQAKLLVNVAGMDIAGVPTPPFSACLLPGLHCTVLTCCKLAVRLILPKTDNERGGMNIIGFPHLSSQPGAEFALVSLLACMHVLCRSCPV